MQAAVRAVAASVAALVADDPTYPKALGPCAACGGAETLHVWSGTLPLTCLACCSRAATAAQ